MAFSQADHQFMQRAITLAKKGCFTTTPNPNVGCVIVKNNEVVGEGFHLQAGCAHAEVNALAQAGEQAKGATAYVTLEPCSHQGRTPPCANALINAQVARVVCAMEDPNPQVSGKGLALLRQAGIVAQSGLLHAQAEQINLGFLKRMRTGLPYVTCKLAASLDGKTALKNGQSKWITSKAARQDVQHYRASQCAILSGADTVIADNARLNVRQSELNLPDYPLKQVRQPTRIIIDSQQRLTPDMALFSIASPIILVRTAVDNNLQWPHYVQQLVMPVNTQQKVDLTALIQHLGQQGFNHVWLEAGATLAGEMTKLGLIDSYLIYLAPKLMGEQGKSLVNLGDFSTVEQVPQLVFEQLTQVGEDIRLTAVLAAKNGTHHPQQGE